MLIGWLVMILNCHAVVASSNPRYDICEARVCEHFAYGYGALAHKNCVIYDPRPTVLALTFLRLYCLPALAMAVNNNIIRQLCQIMAAKGVSDHPGTPDLNTQSNA